MSEEQSYCARADALEELIERSKDPRSLEILSEICAEEKASLAPYTVSKNADLRAMYTPNYERFGELFDKAREKMYQIRSNPRAVQCRA